MSRRYRKVSPFFFVTFATPDKNSARMEASYFKGSDVISNLYRTYIKRLQLMAEVDL
jgi:hypothetical protein